MKFKLIEDWRAVLRRAWTIKLSLAGAALGAMETYFAYQNTGSAPLTAIAATAVSLAIGVARVWDQGIANGDQ